MTGGPFIPNDEKGRSPCWHRAVSTEPRTAERGPLGLPSALLVLLGLTSTLDSAQSRAKAKEDRSFHSRLLKNVLER
jgi:hypothetical protein